MSAPKPLLDEADTSAFERRLLAAAQARRAPDGARERGWAALDGALASGVARPEKPRAENVAGASGGAKIAAAVSAVGLAAALVAGGAALFAAKGPTAVAPPTPAVIASPRARVDEPAPSPAPASIGAPVDVEALPSAPTPRAHLSRRKQAPAPIGSSSSPVGSLREEAALLREARSALVRGDLSNVRTKLDEAAARYPTGQLVQERDAIEVRLAAANGDTDAASTLAHGFIERYPDSPLRSSIEPFVRTEPKR